MLERRFLFDNIEFVKEMIDARCYPDLNIDLLVQEENERKKMLSQLEELRQQFNKMNKTIGIKKSQQKNVEEEMIQVKELAQQIKNIEEKYTGINGSVKQRMLSIPNVPHKSVPIGRTEQDNKEVKKWGEPPQFGFPVRSHHEIGEMLGILDFERAAKIAGSRFVAYRGYGARLERALTQFMLDTHGRDHGYTEIMPPFLANRDSMVNSGQIPKLEEDMFKIAVPEYYLIPTGEVPLVNYRKGEVLDIEELPLKYVCWTPCFRREAGSYGKVTRGLIRQHQFHKVELVILSHPDRSYDLLEQLLLDAEKILQLLELPYRVVSLNTSDLSFAAAKCYDIEVWLPSMGTYREISSCSNCEDFQARRAEIKFRSPEMKKNEFIHTLNGSGLAIGRTMVALLEKYQREDGSVLIPEVLRSYMDGIKVLEGWPSGRRRRS